jgi:hypothetical protein
MVCGPAGVVITNEIHCLFSSGARYADGPLLLTANARATSLSARGVPLVERVPFQPVMARSVQRSSGEKGRGAPGIGVEGIGSDGVWAIARPEVVTAARAVMRARRI